MQRTKNVILLWSSIFMFMTSSFLLYKPSINLVKKLKESGHYVCLSSHSILDEETQSYCDAYLYDKYNPWQINGHPERPNHVCAELLAIHNGIEFLRKYGFKYIFKTCFDLSPNLDVHEIITRSKSKQKRLVTCRNAIDLGTLCFFSDIDFLPQTFNMNELYIINENKKRELQINGQITNNSK